MEQRSIIHIRAFRDADDSLTTGECGLFVEVIGASARSASVSIGFGGPTGGIAPRAMRWTNSPGFIECA